MKKEATLVIKLTMEDTPENMKALQELIESVESKELQNAFAADTDVVAEATISVEDL